MRVAITGASGLLGRGLGLALKQRGDEVVPLSRGPGSGVGPVGGANRWDVATGELHLADAAPLDALVHLAGENIAAGRWTKARKHRLWTSRVDATQRLCAHLAQRRPRLPRLLCASAIGHYGNRGDAALSEASEAGDDFLADLSRAWEAATGCLAEAGTRVAMMRLGVVLGREGGALAKMLPIFKLGLGGVVGSGSQYWSWISLPDAVRAMMFLLDHPDLTGPVNLVSPNPVTNREFTLSLAGVLGRPAFLPAPAFALKLMLGEMAGPMLLESRRVFPQRLTEAGFTFEHVLLEDALRAVLA